MVTLNTNIRTHKSKPLKNKNHRCSNVTNCDISLHSRPDELEVLLLISLIERYQLINMRCTKTKSAQKLKFHSIILELNADQCDKNNRDMHSDYLRPLCKQNDVVKGCFVFKHFSPWDCNLHILQSHCVNNAWKNCGDFGAV